MAKRSPDASGVFTTDHALVIQSWDRWMSEVTGISEAAACGQPLARLFPDLVARGLLERFRRVAEGTGVDVLAPALHKYLIACPPRDPASRFERMRQHVTVSPLRDRAGRVGLTVRVEDVTERFDRERRITADLDHEDETVRLRAAQALADSGQSPLLLANALSDSDWRVRRVAAEGMAVAGTCEATQTLLDALRDHHRDPALLNAALTALTSAPSSRVDLVHEILSLLDADKADTRTYAALALGLLGDARAVPRLIARLEDADINVRFHSIEALGRIGDRAAADPLATIAESRDFFLGFAALDALAAIGESIAAPRLLPLLDDEMLGEAAIACLGAIGAEDVVGPLVELLARGAPHAKTIAVALAGIHERLQTELGEGDLVADVVTAALPASVAQDLVTALPGATEDERRGLVRVLSWLSHDGIDAALASLLGDAALRALVADCLARRGLPAAHQIETLGDVENEEVRKAAARALGRIGSAASVPTLLAWLVDAPEPDSIVAIAGALAAIGDRTAFDAMLALSGHEDPSVRQAAVSALNSIGHPATEVAVVTRLSDPEPHVRESAARVVGYFGYRAGLRRLVDLCDDDSPMVRRAAAEAIGNYDERPAWIKLRETLASDGDASVRAAAARALAQSTSEESRTALVNACTDRNLWVRYYAVRALARRGQPHADVIAALGEIITRDPATPVRIAAIEALTVLKSPAMVQVLMPLARSADSELACAAIVGITSLDAHGPGVELVLRGALRGDDDQRVRVALTSIGQERMSAMIDEVRTLAGTARNAELRALAVQTLSDIGTAETLPALVELAADRRLREPVVRALATADEKCATAMWAACGDSSESSRELLIEAVARMRHGAAARILAAALEDASPAVRALAARGLSRLDLRDARSRLVALAETDEHAAVRAAARDALAR